MGAETSLIKLRNLLVQSAMAGYSDGRFCREMGRAGIGVVTLGGYNVDGPTHHASLEAGKRRKEFLYKPSEVSEVISRQADIARETGAAICVNLRFSTIDNLAEICRELRGSVDMVELNAHCRQPEFTVRGAGQALLDRPQDLARAVDICSSQIPTTMKVRAIRYPSSMSSSMEANGAAGIHLDLMTPGKPEADIDLLREIRKQTSLCIIGNNSVRSPQDFLAMLDAGANLVSMARPLLEGRSAAREILSSPRCRKATRSAATRLPQPFSTTCQH